MEHQTITQRASHAIFPAPAVVIPLQLTAAGDLCSPVVPQCACPRRPPEPNLDVDVFLVHVEEIVQDQIALGLVQPHDPDRHGTVDPERLPARGRVHSDQRVDALDMPGPGGGIVAIEVLVGGAVHGLLAIDEFPEFGRQLLVRTVTRGPDRVAPHRRHRVVVQVRDARGLPLVHKISVPPRRTPWPAEAGAGFLDVKVGPYDRDTGNTGNLGRLGL